MVPSLRRRQVAVVVALIHIKAKSQLFDIRQAAVMGRGRPLLALSREMRVEQGDGSNGNEYARYTLCIPCILYCS
jgi:hypothetical protein